MTYLASLGENWELVVRVHHLKVALDIWGCCLSLFAVALVRSIIKEELRWINLPQPKT